MRSAGFKIFIKRAFADGLQSHILMSCRTAGFDIFEEPLRGKAVCFDSDSFFTEIICHAIPAYRPHTTGFESSAGVPVVRNARERNRLAIAKRSHKRYRRKGYHRRNKSSHEVIIT